MVMSLYKESKNMVYEGVVRYGEWGGPGGPMLISLPLGDQPQDGIV